MERFSMIRVSIDMSVPTTAMDGDAVLDVAMAIGMALNENPMEGMVIHRIEVEQADA